MQSAVCWVAGAIFLFLAPFGGRLAKEYEREDDQSGEMIAMCFGWGFTLAAALLWRVA